MPEHGDAKPEDNNRVGADEAAAAVGTLERPVSSPDDLVTEELPAVPEEEPAQPKGEVLIPTNVDAIRAEVDALSPEDKGDIKRMAATMGWDNLHKEEVEALRGQVDEKAERVATLLARNGWGPEHEKVKFFANMARGSQLQKLVEAQVANPTVLKEPAQQTGEAGVVQEEGSESFDLRVTLNSILTTQSTEYRDIMRKWDLHIKTQTVNEYDELQKQAQSEMDNVAAEREAVRRQLDEKHSGLLGKINAMPVPWDELKRAINGGDNPEESCSALYDKFKTDEYGPLAEELAELLDDEEIAKQLATDMFVNSYINEHLMVLFPDDTDANVADAAREDLARLLQEEGVIADMNTYARNLMVGDKNYEKAPKVVQPEPRVEPATETEASAEPTPTQEQPAEKKAGRGAKLLSFLRIRRR